MRSACVSFALLAACGSTARGAPATPSKPSAAPPYEPGSLPALRVPGPLSPRIASYRIDARLDYGAKRITGTQTLTWKHTGSAPVTSLPFHLYMNAFKNDATVFMRESGGRHRGQRAAGGKWGWIDVSSIKLGDTELRPAAKFGEDETTLEVPLPTPALPGAEVVLTFSFTTQLPQVFARTGYMGDFMMVGQWFPKIGVLAPDPQAAGGAGQRWHCDTFHLNSEFFADFGSYDVTLDVPADLVVAATGVLTKSEDAEGARRRLAYRAEDVHDFAWMVDPRMRVAQTVTKDGVRILVYHRPEQARFAPRHLEAARRTIETFSRLFYDYPWSVMTVIDPPVEADGSAGGMEYPTLVTTAADRALAPRGVNLPETVTVHEVGHNWFQGILASNEVDEAWLDEGLNEYADGIVLEEWFGADASVLGFAGLRLGYYEGRRLASDFSDDPVPVATRSYQFPDNATYGELTYGKTALALKTLENMLGRDRFFVALGAYAERHAFKHPTREDLFGSLSAALGEDVSWFLRPAFETTGSVALEVSRIRTRKRHPPRGVFGEGDARQTVDEKAAPDEDTWISEVTVINAGGVPAMVDVRFRFADGSERRERWDDLSSWKTFTLEGPEPVVEVELDPNRHILLEQERLDNALRVVGEASASWRAAARVGFWEQTILQLVGF